MGIQNRRQLILALAGTGTAAVLSACSAAVPTQAPAKEAAKAAPVTDKLFMMVDIVQGSKNLTGDAAKMRSCALSSRFSRNSEMVFRARVFDPKSGEPMDDKTLKSLVVELANGKSFAAKWGAHPKEPPNEFYWTGSWVVPKDHASGTLKFLVTATAVDGRVGKFEPMPVVPSLPAITEDILADAPAKA